MFHGRQKIRIEDLCRWVHDFDVIFKESLNFEQSLTKDRSVQKHVQSYYTGL